MRNFFRSFRFWLSWLIFEKWLKKELAQPKGEKIARRTDEWNRNTLSKKCSRCDMEMIKDRSGSEGLFTEPHIFWRCPQCHSTENEDSCRYKFEELDSERLLEDGDGKYRYAFFNNLQRILLFFLFIIAVATFIAMVVLPKTF